MSKKIAAMVLAITLIFGTNTFIYAAEIPAYEITDTYVRIDYKVYQIEDNTIQYNGRVYEIIDYALVSQEDDGTPIVLVLPVEQNKITDPERIAELNESIKHDNSVTRDVPSSYVNLPYTASIPEGQWMNITPAFKMLNAKFYYFTTLKLYDFPLFADKRFAVKFTYCTPLGDWYDHAYINEWNFTLLNNTIKYENLSVMAYGRMAITNLYADPSPSYTFTITLANPIPTS